MTIKDLAKLRNELSDLRFDARGSGRRYIILATDAIENALKWDVSYIREPLMAICRFCTTCTFCVGEQEDDDLIDAVYTILLALLDCTFADYNIAQIEEYNQCDVGGD